MFKILSPLSVAIFAATLPQILLAEENTADAGYPAPPGIYGQAEILKNSQFNMGSGSPYIVIEDQPASFMTEKATESSAGQQTSNQPVSQQEPPETAAKENLPSTALIPQPAPHDSRPAEASWVAPARQDNTGYPLPPAPAYPDAAQIRQQYQEAEQLPFDQWGQLPESDSADYGSPSVPIDTTRPRFFPETGFNAPGNMPYNYPAQTNPAAQYQQQRYFNPDYMVGKYFGNRSGYDWTPPSAAYLPPIDQLPVPQLAPAGDLYGLPAQKLPTPGANVQYMPRIPEEDIIYPPSYPGNR